jgi:hypothetical protein
MSRQPQPLAPLITSELPQHSFRQTPEARRHILPDTDDCARAPAARLREDHDAAAATAAAADVGVARGGSLATAYNGSGGGNGGGGGGHVEGAGVATPLVYFILSLLSPHFFGACMLVTYLILCRMVPFKLPDLRIPHAAIVWGFLGSGTRPGGGLVPATACAGG